MRVPLTLLIVATLVAGCGGDSTPQGGASPTGDGDAQTVVRVVDGDTLIVADARGEQRTVRLLGIDTPESVKPDAPVDCFGPEASARATELLPEGSEVRVELDPTQDAIDDFGRTLAYVTPDGANASINERLVAEGYARVYISRGTPFAREPAFTAREREARDANRGLWGACRSAGPISAGVAPAGRDCPAGYPVKGNLPSRIYHVDGDPDYAAVNPERCFRNAASAEDEGFRPVRG